MWEYQCADMTTEAAITKLMFFLRSREKSSGCQAEADDSLAGGNDSLIRFPFYFLGKFWKGELIIISLHSVRN